MKATIKRLQRLERTCPKCRGAMDLHCSKCGKEPLVIKVVYPEDEIAEEAEVMRQRFQECLNT